MKFNIFKSKLIGLIIVVLFFSIAGGIFGELIARIYFFENIFSLPFYGEINLTGNNNNNANLVIRDAKKVVVEQDSKIDQTIQGINDNIVGIFKVKAKTDDYLGNLYFFNDAYGQGIILTSDGWLIADLTKSPIGEKVLNNFLAATSKGKIYSIDKIVNDPLSDYSFLHLKDAKDLPVSQLASENDIANGKTIIAYGWDKESSVFNISAKLKQKIHFSDIINDEFLFSGLASSSNEKVFIYDLAGKFVGFINKENRIYPVYNLYPALNSVLKKGKISRIKLGLNYADLSDYISSAGLIKGALVAKNSEGASLLKNSPAFLAGLKEGDLITQIDAFEINDINKLNILIQKHKAGDKVDFIFDRSGEKKNLNITLDEY